MSLPQLSLKYPYLVLAFVLIVVVMGSLAYVIVPTDLFPETVPPQVAVITVAPGVSAKDIADKVTRNIEKELGSLAGLKRISSVSRDEVSAITAEFLFSKPMGEAVIDVQNAVARVRGILPSDIREPLLYRITDATRPLVTLALSPGPDSLKTLSDIRLLAENDLRDEIMAVTGVGDVQVFGGHTPEIEIRVDRDTLTRHGLSLTDVISGLARQNVAAPGGIVYGARQEYLLKVSGELSGLQALEEMPLAVDSGSQILLRDVAQVRAGESDQRSRYHGNSTEAVALNVLRPEKGHTIKALAALKRALPGIKANYPDILFEITDDQQPLIDLNVQGMRFSLWQAMLLTILLIFVFLADLRAAAVVSAAIPLSFLAALIVLWISPYTLNMVTLSGLIVAVGMVVDASVVVLENIHRHHKQNNYTDAVKAALTGAGQVAMPITAGMLTTVAVLVPVIFTTGYTGRTMRPLNITIVSTLVASLIVSLTVIPILAARFFKGPDKVSDRVRYLLSPVQKGVEFLTIGYEQLVTLALKYRYATAIILLIFMIFSLRVVKPLLGGEQMPPMDTGIVTIQFDTDSSAKPEEVNTTLSQIEAILNQHPAVLTISSVVGSEPGSVSFGGGKATSQSANITVRLTPRTQRIETIWEIEAGWREHLGKLPGVRTFRVSEYGATPVSTTKAPFNAILSGPDSIVLNSLADKAMDLLDGTPGLMDLRRSWYLDKIEQKIIVDPHLAGYYGTSPAEVASFLRMAVQGIVATTMRLDGFYDLPVRVRYRSDQVDDLGRLEELPVPTRAGSVRLGNIAKIITLRTQPFITRENQRTTMDITAGNSGLTIAQATAAAKKRLAGLSLPKGYTLDIAGTARDMQETQVSLGNALVVGLALLFILLMAMFKSLAHPITIILSIPLAAAGGVWGLLFFDKPFCMPALMGFILLGGTIVNNAILMLDFIIEARKKGLGKDQAILQSVRLRLRPILITAVSTMVGFSPLIFETAVGLERMSPLGIAAASGLLVGTIVTLVAVPVIYSLLDSLKSWLARSWNGKKIASVTSALLLIAAVFCAPAKVQAITPFSGSLSLDEAVRIALEHNPDLEAAKAEIDLLQGGVMQTDAAKGIHMNLTGQGGWSEKRHAQVSGLSSMEQGFAHVQYQGILSATWLVTDFGKTQAQLRSALNLQEAGVSLEQRKQQEVVFSVSLQFLEAMTIRDLLEATSGTRDSLQAFAQSIRSQIAKGRAPEVDDLKINIRLAEVESQLADLGRNLQVSRAALARLMGVEEKLPVLTSSPVADIEAPESEIPGIPDIKNRLDIKAQELMVQAGQERILAAERDSLPRVELFANAGLYGATDPETGIGQKDDDPWKNDVSGGIRITLPLLDNGLRKSNLAISRAEFAKTRAVLRAKRLAAKQEIIIARASVNSARVKIKATQKTIIHAKKVVQIEQLKYRIGRGTSAEVLEAETALLNAESLSRMATRELSIARLAVHLALGDTI
jgi:multidrug efflux pump subunit AcrB/outer membrane protein TolC